MAAATLRDVGEGPGITAEAVEAEKFISYEREMEKATGAVESRRGTDGGPAEDGARGAGDGDCAGWRRVAAETDGFFVRSR